MNLKEEPNKMMKCVLFVDGGTNVGYCDSSISGDDRTPRRQSRDDDESRYAR